MRTLSDYTKITRGIPRAAQKVIGLRPYYSTHHGAAFLGNSLDVLPHIKECSINLILTSPPYALIRKKRYGNPDEGGYVRWFKSFIPGIERVLAEDGSIVIVVGGAWKEGSPTRSTYQFELLLELTKTFSLAQEFYWHNPAKLPSPAEWVTVRRERVKDSVEPIWWLTKTAYPKADNRRVLRSYSEAMQDLIASQELVPALRPSGHRITDGFLEDNGGSIPPNLLRIANTDSNSRYLRRCRKAGCSPHPARFPVQLPDFFIRFLTDPGDCVLDPFAGSNTTGYAAEKLGRSWVAIERERAYLDSSKLRFR